MKKFAKLLTSAGIAASITFGGVVVAPVATAQPAQAYSTSSCYDYYRQNIGTYTWSKWRSCYFDYSPWEESWFGGSHRDGRRDWQIPVYA